MQDIGVVWRVFTYSMHMRDNLILYVICKIWISILIEWHLQISVNKIVLIIIPNEFKMHSKPYVNVLPM